MCVQIELHELELTSMSNGLASLCQLFPLQHQSYSYPNTVKILSNILHHMYSSTSWGSRGYKVTMRSAEQDS